MYTIYRYEKDGLGPYRSFKDSYKLQNAHRNRKDRLNLFDDFPTNDERILQYRKYKCACPTEKLLKNWFRGFNSRLRKDGVDMYEIKVKEMVTGKSGYQVFFRDEDVISKTKIS